MSNGASPSILHFDLDAFFAAVEVLLNPALAGKPLIIGGDPRRRGVVSTASYEARAFGVHSAMPAAIAKRLCPQAIFLPPRHAVYKEHSERVFRIVARYADQIEAISIDEAFVQLDAADPVAAARELKAAIRAETGLVASMGLATSKLVSKIASDHGKPDGFVVVPPGTEATFLAPMPARKLWGVGPRTAERLAALGIVTIGDLARADLTFLARHFGPQQARALIRRARGEDYSPVEVSREIKSISDEVTFARDQGDARELWRVLATQCAHCAQRLARRGLVARTVTIKLRFGDFHTITRSRSLAVPTDDTETIRAAVAALMRQSWSSDRRPLRLVGVRVSGLTPAPAYVQLRLFD